jgi:hypothetical protein
LSNTATTTLVLCHPLLACLTSLTPPSLVLLSAFCLSHPAPTAPPLLSCHPPPAHCAATLPPPCHCILLLPPPALFKPSTACSCCRQRGDITATIVATTSSLPTNKGTHPCKESHSICHGHGASSGARDVVGITPALSLATPPL